MTPSITGPCEELPQEVCLIRNHAAAMQTFSIWDSHPLVRDLSALGCTCRAYNAEFSGVEPHDRPAIWVDWDPKPATLESLSAAAEQLRTNGPGNVARSYASIRVDGIKYSAKYTPTPNSPIKAAP